MLIRGVVIVTPKQPYLDWYAGLDDSGILSDPAGEQTVYLVPSFESEEEAWALLGEVHDDIFRNERWGWHTDPAAWPKDRSFDSFKQWFRIAFHSIVEDLCDDEIVDEDDEADDE